MMSKCLGGDVPLSVSDAHQTDGKKNGNLAEVHQAWAETADSNVLIVGIF
jgi:hypothetical protein